MSKLVVIEGLDGCGKSTQLELLKEAFPTAKVISFPDYESQTGKLIKSCLAGDIAANRYAAACFYATDRYNSFMKNWQHIYHEGTPIICGRYTTSNMIYQGASLIDRPNELEAYLKWLEDLEYSKLLIPRPDKVIYLDIPLAVSKKLLEKRYNGDASKKDIFERNDNFRAACEKTANYLISRNSWKRISCVTSNNDLKSIESIHKEIIKEIDSI